MPCSLGFSSLLALGAFACCNELLPGRFGAGNASCTGPIPSLSRQGNALCVSRDLPRLQVLYKVFNSFVELGPAHIHATDYVKGVGE